ncbi:universal stress protein [Chitinivorax tropicus]|nr:universal stress protein [Chitinivorax tropicus]
MFKHILVPTDGSPLSEMAVKAAVQMAGETGAKITSIYVMDLFPVTPLLEYAPVSTPAVADFQRQQRGMADRYLSKVEALAKEGEVPCVTDAVTGDSVYQCIIAAAEHHGCDLILMASHGRRGLQGLLLGSETNKVLTHSRIPVLVYR